MLKNRTKMNALTIVRIKNQMRLELRRNERLVVG